MLGISSSWVKPSCGRVVFSIIPALLKQLVIPVLNILGREKSLALTTEDENQIEESEKLQSAKQGSVANT